MAQTEVGAPKSIPRIEIAGLNCVGGRKNFDGLFARGCSGVLKPIGREEALRSVEEIESADRWERSMRGLFGCML